MVTRLARNTLFGSVFLFSELSIFTFTEKTLADPQRNISGNAGYFTGCFGEDA
jgi:hypothetical protein